MPDSESLRGARERALAALEVHEQTDELRSAAELLGTALFATAEDADLWGRLGSIASGARQTLTSEQRNQLRGVSRVDWAWLLNESGYAPPPPAEAYAIELQRAIADALETGEQTDLDAARSKLRSVGALLLELSGQPDVSYERLRRAVRNGVKVAAKVLIIIGVVVGTAVISGVVSAALPPVAPLLVLGGVGLVAEGAGRVLERAVDKLLSEDEPEPEAGPDPDDWEALALGRGVRDPETVGLVEAWREIEGLPPGSLVEQTRAYFDQTKRSFYATWDATTGAVWYPAVRGPFEDADWQRRRLEEQLQKEPLDPVEIADRLQTFGIATRRAREELDRILGS